MTFSFKFADDPELLYQLISQPTIDKITIDINGTEICVSKLLLCAKGNYFKTMLQNDFCEKNNNLIKIESKFGADLIHYLSNTLITIDENNYLQFYAMADYFCIDSVKSTVQTFFDDYISSDSLKSLIEKYPSIDSFFSINLFGNYIIDNCSHVLNTRQFKTGAVYYYNHGCDRFIIERYTDISSSCDYFQKISRELIYYIINQCEQNKDEHVELSVFWLIYVFYYFDVDLEYANDIFNKVKSIVNWQMEYVSLIGAFIRKVGSIDTEFFKNILYDGVMSKQFLS